MHNTDFTIHIINGHISTIYLAVYRDRILVLDGGCRCDVPAIEYYIRKKLNRSLKAVKLIIASHCHPDHGAGSPCLAAKHKVPLAAPRDINSWYQGAGGFIQHKIDTLLGYYVARAYKRPLKNMLYKRFVHYDIALTDHMTLPGFEDWEVIAAPGHTSHDIVFYNKKQAILYAADVILRVNRKFILPFPVPLRTNMDQSLEKISGLDVRHLLLAHGGYVKVDGLQAITIALQADLTKQLHPAFKKISVLQYFSPEIKRAKKRDLH